MSALRQKAKWKALVSQHEKLRHGVLSERSVGKAQLTVDFPKTGQN